MKREVQIIFPNNSAVLTVNYTPQFGEIIDHNTLGRGMVAKIITFITRVDTTESKNQFQSTYEDIAVTKAVLIEI